MRKRVIWLFSFAFAVTMMLAAFSVTAGAAAAGTCGDHLAWSLDDAGTLTISGTENMDNYYSFSSVPWYNECGKIKTIVIEYGVTDIGAWAFQKCSNLISVDLPASVTSIGSVHS